MSTLMFPEYAELYRLSDPLGSRPLRLSDENFSDWLTSEQAWALFRGQLRLTKPLRLGAYMGGHPSDFLWAGLSHVVCVSHRVVESLIEDAVTGWSIYNVEVFGRKGEPLPGHHGFSVIGPECPLDRSRSQIVTKPPPAPGGKSYQVYRGLYLDESQWDGSDFFVVRPFGGIVVTEKVYRLFKRAKVTNVRLTPLTEVELDVMLDQFEKSE